MKILNIYVETSLFSLLQTASGTFLWHHIVTSFRTGKKIMWLPKELYWSNLQLHHVCIGREAREVLIGQNWQYFKASSAMYILIWQK